MNRRQGFVVALCTVAVLAACSSGSASRVSATAPTTNPSTTTTTVLAERLGGTGTANLMHSGPHGFVLFNGTFTSPLLGHGKFHEDATFGTKPNTNPYWTGKATFTATNGDALTVRTVGGVQSFDAQNDPDSATRETVIGGTGRFAGATGTWSTTGVTLVRHLSPTIDLQTYKFQFTGTIKLKP